MQLWRYVTNDKLLNTILKSVEQSGPYCLIIPKVSNQYPATFSFQAIDTQLLFYIRFALHDYINGVS